MTKKEKEEKVKNLGIASVLRGENGSLKRSIKTLEREARDLEAKLERANFDLKTRTSTMMHQRKKIEELEESNAGMAEEIRGLKSEERRALRSESSLRGENEELETEIDIFKEEIKKISEAVGEMAVKMERDSIIREELEKDNEEYLLNLGILKKMKETFGQVAEDYQKQFVILKKQKRADDITIEGLSVCLKEQKEVVIELEETIRDLQSTLDIHELYAKVLDNLT